MPMTRLNLVLPSHKGPMAAMTSVSISLCQTPAEAATANPYGRTRGSVSIASGVECLCLAPTPSLCRYQFILPGEQRHMCVNNLPRVVRLKLNILSLIHNVRILFSDVVCFTMQCNHNTALLHLLSVGL